MASNYVPVLPWLPFKISPCLDPDVTPHRTCLSGSGGAAAGGTISGNGNPNTLGIIGSGSMIYYDNAAGGQPWYWNGTVWQ